MDHTYNQQDSLDQLYPQIYPKSISNANCKCPYHQNQFSNEVLDKIQEYSNTAKHFKDLKSDPNKNLSTEDKERNSKRYENFVVAKRAELKELKVCEKACTKILHYSLNFIYGNNSRGTGAVAKDKIKDEKHWQELKENFRHQRNVCCSKSQCLNDKQKLSIELLNEWQLSLIDRNVDFRGRRLVAERMLEKGFCKKAVERVTLVSAKTCKKIEKEQSKGSEDDSKYHEAHVHYASGKQFSKCEDYINNDIEFNNRHSSDILKLTSNQNDYSDDTESTIKNLTDKIFRVIMDTTKNKVENIVREYVSKNFGKDNVKSMTSPKSLYTAFQPPFKARPTLTIEKDLNQQPTFLNNKRRQTKNLNFKFNQKPSNPEHQNVQIRNSDSNRKRDAINEYQLETHNLHLPRKSKKQHKNSTIALYSKQPNTQPYASSLAESGTSHITSVFGTDCSTECSITDVEEPVHNKVNKNFVSKKDALYKPKIVKNEENLNHLNNRQRLDDSTGNLVIVENENRQDFSSLGTKEMMERNAVDCLTNFSIQKKNNQMMEADNNVSDEDNVTKMYRNGITNRTIKSSKGISTKHYSPRTPGNFIKNPTSSHGTRR